MKVSLRDAYLYSLRADLLKNFGSASNAVTDSDLERLFDSSTEEELLRKSLTLPVKDKEKFLSSLSSFVQRRGHLPKESDLVPPPLKVKINQDGLEKLDGFVDSYKLHAEKLAFEWEEVDFRTVVDLAKEVNPDFESSLYPEDLSSVDTELWRVLSDDLLMQVLLPTNNGLFINLIQNNEPLVFDFLVNRRSWHQETSYLDNIIWSCDAALRGAYVPINSQTYKNFALVDKDKCVAEGLSTYLNIIVAPRNKSHSILKQAKITPDLYTLLFSYKRVMKRQAAFARDMMLIKEWTELEKAKSFGMSEDDKYKTVLLKENSPLSKLIGEFDREGVPSLIISSFSSAFSGVISEMEELIKSGKHEFATMAFLDFYGLAEVIDPKLGTNINVICSFLSLKFVNQLLDGNPKTSALIKEINHSNLSEKAEELLLALKEVHAENLKGSEQIIF